MKRVVAALLLLSPGVALAAPAPAPAAEKQAPEANAGFKLIHTDELAGQLAKKDSGVVVLDANDAEFRAKQGIIPGAKLLSSFDGYDLAKELPASKATPLVFYCANSH